MAATPPIDVGEQPREMRGLIWSHAGEDDAGAAVRRFPDTARQQHATVRDLALERTNGLGARPHVDADGRAEGERSAGLDHHAAGAELTLHLGPDPAFTLERVALSDVLEGPGIFSMDATHVQAWRVRLSNAGAAIAGADGVAEVLVREALPRTLDDRIEIKLASSTAKPDDAPDSRKLREQWDFLTWRVRVPKAGTASFEWKLETSYPAKLTLVGE